MSMGSILLYAISVSHGVESKSTMRNLSRRKFVSSLGGLALAPLLHGCGTGEAKPFSVAAHVWPGYEPLFLARTKGWLDEKRVRLVETPSATSSLNALSNGIVEAAALTLDEVLRARASGLSLGVVLVFDVSAGADMVLARPGINTLADLKGRLVGVEQGGLGAVMLSSALQSAGLATKDVRQVSIVPADQLNAWRDGQLDAVVTYEPVASKLLEDGAIQLFDSRQMPQMIVDVLAVRSEALKSQQASIRHLLVSHFRALHFLLNSFRDASELIAPRMHLHPDKLRSVFKGLDLPEVDSNRRLLAGATPELLSSARKLSGSMVKAGLLSREDTLAALLHADFLPTEGRS